MNKQQSDVKAFHKRFGLTVSVRPCVANLKDRRLRIRLIREELKELGLAKNLVEVADALGDLLYVVLGAAVTYGIDLAPVFNEIHRSNMTKVWPDGTVKRDAGGKVMKPPGYSPADILKMLEKQGLTVDEALAPISKCRYGENQRKILEFAAGRKGEVWTAEDLIAHSVFPPTARRVVIATLSSMFQRGLLWQPRHGIRGKRGRLAGYRWRR